MARTTSRKKSPPGSDTDADRLVRAVQRSVRAMDWFRTNRRAMAADAAGPYYADDDSIPRMPVNDLSLYHRTVTRKLVPKSPRLLIATAERSQAAAVDATMKAVNRIMEESHVEDPIRYAAADAGYYMGVVMVSLTTPEDAHGSGYANVAGRPGVYAIDFDDFVIDMTAKTLTGIAYAGHCYTAPLEAVRSDKRFTRERLKLEPTNRRRVTAGGSEMAWTIAGDATYDTDGGYEDTVDLWDIYLPRTKRVVTLPDDGSGVPEATVLCDREWVGPACGPYHYLRFGTVPGNLMGRGPVLDLYDLNDEQNRLWRKMFDQTDRQKTITVFQVGATDDANAVRRTPDGGVVGLENPDSVGERAFGGPNQSLALMAPALRDNLNRQAGNLDALGGLGAREDTLGQTQIVTAGAGGTLADMQQDVAKFVASVGRALAWFWWEHPEAELTDTVEDYARDGVRATRRVYPRGKAPRPTALERKLPFDQLDIRVDPYSMQYQTPAAKLQNLNALMVNTVIPLAGQLQQQGAGVDVVKFLEVVADLGELPELKDIVTAIDPTAVRNSAPDAGVTKPPTNSTYTRVSRSDGSQQPEGGRTQRLVEAMNSLQAAGRTGVQNSPGG